MPKLVVLSEKFTGRTHELKSERLTVGRADDNGFSIPEASVSSHHCEILVQDGQVRVKDLNSTNGTYINDEKVTESVLKPGQILRLGQVEMRLVDGEQQEASAKDLDHTMVLNKGAQGVKLNELDGSKKVAVDKEMFKKQSDKATLVFIGAAVLIAAAIIAFIVIAIMKMQAS